VLGPSGHQGSTNLRHCNSLVVVVPTLVPALIIRIAQTIAVVLHIVPKSLNFADLVAGPIGDVFRSVLNIVHSVVPLALDAIAKASEALLHVVGNLLDFADTAACPLGSIFGEVGGGLFEAVFILVPVLF
jgi:hypothetical protein